MSLHESSSKSKHVFPTGTCASTCIQYVWKYMQSCLGRSFQTEIFSTHGNTNNTDKFILFSTLAGWMSISKKYMHMQIHKYGFYKSWLWTVSLSKSSFIFTSDHTLTYITSLVLAASPAVTWPLCGGAFPQPPTFLSWPVLQSQKLLSDLALV